MSLDASSPLFFLVPSSKLPSKYLSEIISQRLPPSLGLLKWWYKSKANSLKFLQFEFVFTLMKADNSNNIALFDEPDILGSAILWYKSKANSLKFLQFEYVFTLMKADNPNNIALFDEPDKLGSAILSNRFRISDFVPWYKLQTSSAILCAVPNSSCWNNSDTSFCPYLKLDFSLLSIAVVETCLFFDFWRLFFPGRLCCYFL